MIKGIYTSASAMRTNVLRQDVTANNLANANATGFKRDRMFVQDLISAGKQGDTSGDLPVAASRWTEFTPGAYEPTGNSLDFALQGRGFFVVSDGTTESYTRNGHFERNAAGQLVDALGRTVMGEGGAITLPHGIATVSASGEVNVNSVLVDKLRVVDFQNPQTLQKGAGQSFVRGAATTDAAVDRPVVRQGFLEGSNVETVQEMVEMISTARNYEINAKLLTAQDDSLRLSVGELGRV
jgi:flagellar basal-body rod protein FlgF